MIKWAENDKGSKYLSKSFFARICFPFLSNLTFYDGIRRRNDKIYKMKIWQYALKKMARDSNVICMKQMLNEN